MAKEVQKRPAAVREEDDWIVAPINQAGREITTQKPPGATLPAEVSRQMMATARLSAGPEVYRSMATLINNLAVNAPHLLPDMEYDEFGDEGVAENVEAENAGVIDENVVNLPQLATQALVNPQQNGTDVLPVNPNWHGFTRLAVNEQHAQFMRRMGREIFSMFPCFDRQVQNNGERAVDGIQTLLSLGIRPNQNVPAAVNMQVQAQQRMSNTKAEMDAMVSWISRNGILVDRAELRFPELLPGYVPRIVMAVTDNRTFLLVQEDTGLADFSFEPETMEFSFMVKPNKTIRPGHVLHRIRLDEANVSAREMDNVAVDFEMGSRVSLIRENENNLTIVYDGPEMITGGGIVTARLQSHNQDRLSEMVLDRLSQAIPTEGLIDDGRGGSAPIDATYIYSWEGGRQHYLANPDSQNRLQRLFTSLRNGGAYEIAAPVAREQNINAPQRENVQPLPPVIPVVNHVPNEADEKPKPVTKGVTRPNAAPAKQKANPILLMSKELGFQKGMSQGVFCMHKQNEDGNFVVVKSATNSPLPVTAAFSVALKEDIDSEESIVQVEVSSGDFETTIRELLDSRQNARKM